MSDPKFVHLHVHSHYSLLDGANKIDALMERASKLNMPAIALTDHGNLFGAVQFHDKALQYGIKPIIGCEVYVSRTSRKVKSGRSDQSNHLVLLAQNQKGYHNLVKLVSKAYLEGFYYRPRIDLELLETHSAGLIGLSACLKGSVAWNIARDNPKEAYEQAGRLSEILGKGQFYLEMQDHGIDDQHKVNDELPALSRKLDLPLVATNDCHYLKKDDAFAHDVLLCVQTGKNVQDPNRLRYATDQFFFKSAGEMEKIFGHVSGALSRTLEIAERCDFGFGDTEMIFPEFEVPAGSTLDSYFEKVVREGFAERLEQLEKKEKEGDLGCPLSSYRERLDLEIRMIQKMRFSGYFLIVWDFMRYARESGIPVGPGRGSAAGSLASYAMRITDIDPLQYGLLFERFLNPERVTPPDIDIDFCMLRRSEVIDYVTQKYGRDNVSQIITFGTMAARGAVRDVGRSLNISYAEVDKIAKLIPQTPGSTLEKAFSSVKELQKLSQQDERYAQLLEVAGRLEGLSRHASTHAAGVVIAPKPLTELIPLFKSTKDEITTQYPMTDLERLGLLKMDFLALTTLTVIHQALEQIHDQLDEALDLDQIPLDDEATFKLFSQGRTTGIFQFESGGMRDILRRLQPDRFEDLIALNALYRPGPIQGGMIDEFIARRHGQVAVNYEAPELEEFLEETYGVIVYQEQVMQIASKLAGFSLGDADLLRRAMGKKKKKVMEAQRDAFISGCDTRGISETVANQIFELIEQFAAYGFNKSHSTAYALLAYQTAYLKTHYPVQFMAAMLTSEMSNTDKIVKYLSECKEMAITICPPDINSSPQGFWGDGQSIKFGLAAIRNVGEAAIRSILEQRDKVSQFKDFMQFCDSVDLRVVNKRVIEALIKSGAFDSMGYNRKSLTESLDEAVDHAQKLQRDRLSGQRGLFASSEQEVGPSWDVTRGGEDWVDRERWAFEKETLGFYVTGHPLERYQLELERFSNACAAEFTEEFSGRELAVGGTIVNVKPTRTRKGDLMATFQLEDLTGTLEVLLWPSGYEKFQNDLNTDSPVLVKGVCEVDGRGETRLLCSQIVRLDSVWDSAVQRTCIAISLEELSAAKMAELQTLLDRYPGNCPVEFSLSDTRSGLLKVIPTEELNVAPAPGFVRDIERLFGERSVKLYT